MTDVHIAALIVAHRDPQQLEALLSRLSGPMWTPIVHVDVGADLEAFDAVTGCERRVRSRRVRWGAFSFVSAVLDLIGEGLLARPMATHFVLMSGQCFPIVPDSVIADRIRRHGGNLISCKRMPVYEASGERKGLDRLQKRQYDGLTPEVVRRVANLVARRLPDRDVEKLLRGMVPYGGSTWWLLSRSSAEVLVRFLAEEPWVPQAFRYARNVDEMFFHTCLRNLGVSIDGPSPTGAVWLGGAIHPEPLHAWDIDRLRAGGSLFARKFPMADGSRTLG